MIVAKAKELKERVEKLGLVPFAKTTGGKGLHVVTPFDAGKSLRWPQAKAIAREICARMAADSPDKYLVNMSKTKRRGKIFLDYLRNDRMATAVAPLSPRAREGATVSMPLQWSAVKKGLDPKRFTVRSAPALLAKSNAWKDYAKGERPLLAVLKKAGEVSIAQVSGASRWACDHQKDQSLRMEKIFSPICTKSRLRAATHCRKARLVPCPGISQSCSSTVSRGKLGLPNPSAGRMVGLPLHPQCRSLQ